MCVPEDSRFSALVVDKNSSQKTIRVFIRSSFDGNLLVSWVAGEESVILEV